MKAIRFGRMPADDTTELAMSFGSVLRKQSASQPNIVVMAIVDGAPEMRKLLIATPKI